ncbi:MAG: hypothetical protein KTM48_03465 [Wolbachia endosymbiont of Pissodes strobi]|nr:hypothetical protein [Wolbachia endosymbiont of Pissodes strobi]
MYIWASQRRCNTAIPYPRLRWKDNITADLKILNVDHPEEAMDRERERERERERDRRKNHLFNFV